MQTVSSRFQYLVTNSLIPIDWGFKMSLTKQYETDSNWFTLDDSLLDGMDILKPSDDNDLQNWFRFIYEDYTSRVISLEWTREIDFPYSVQSAMADITVQNTDRYFTPDPAPPPIPDQITNHSVNPSLELGSGTVEIRRNFFTNPTFRTNLSGWTHSFGSWVRFSSSNVNVVTGFGAYSDFPSGVGANSTLFFQPTLGVAAGTYTLSFLVNHNHSSALTFATRVNGSDLSTTSVPPNTWVRISGTGSVVNNSGAGIRNISAIPNGVRVNVSGFMLERVGTALPYFDGTYNTWQSPDLMPSWVGTADASYSILKGVGVLGAEVRSGTAGYISPAWLSTQSPNHGQKFARALVNFPSAVAFTTTDTLGIASGDSRTSSLMSRFSRTVTSTQRLWRTNKGDGFSVADSSNLTLTANTWIEAKNTGSPATADANYAMWLAAAQIQAGDLFDIDNHYAIDGTYTGVYRDGSYVYDGWGWNGTQDNSISSGNDPTWVAPVVPIQSYIIPKRPVMIYQGFKTAENLGQFVGLTQGMPQVTDTDARFHALDFLSEMYDMPLSNTIAMRDVRTDEVLANIFSQMGLTPSQYSLARGRNIIPFLFFEKGMIVGSALRQIMQAEGGLLWLDEQGIFRFTPRVGIGQSPVYTIDHQSVVKGEIKTLQYDQIINHVKIHSDVREVQSFQSIHTKNASGDSISNLWVVPAGGKLQKPLDLTDPAVSAVVPTLGIGTGVSWFTAKKSNGDPVVANITATGELLQNSYMVEFTNNNSFPVEIDELDLWGEPALLIDEEGMRYELENTVSISLYGRKTLEINNPFIGNENNANSLAIMILDGYSEYKSRLQVAVKPNPALQLGDIVDVDYDDYQGTYKIDKIVNTLNIRGNITQQLILRKYTAVDWFQLSSNTDAMSLLDSTAVLSY